MSNIDLVLNQARAWIGCKESNGSHKQIIDVYNAYTPLARGYKVKYTDNWCMTYVSACFIKAGFANLCPLECSCGQAIELAKQMGIWNEDGSIIPNKGDIIMYDWDKKDGWPEHTGLVEFVSGRSIKIAEGNKSNAVGYRTIEVGSSSIRGYIQPKYSGATATTPSTPSTGTETSQSTSGFTTGTYTITASDLIVRDAPNGNPVGHGGLSADGKAHDKDGDGALDKGTRITVSQISVSGNDIWGKCPSGWVCLKKENSVYAVKDGSSSASTGSSSSSSSTSNSKTLGTYEVTASDLSVRTGPGTNYRRKTYSELTADAKNHDYDKDGCINQGTRVTVKEWSGNWARIPSGWVSGDYLKKV